MAKWNLRKVLRNWKKSRSGAVAVYMAILLPVLIGAIGMSIDLAQSYLIRERLSRALDAAALAVAGSSALETEAEMLARVNQFMDANYPEEKIGVAYDIDIHVEGDDVRVSAAADYNTFFIHILGHDRVTVRSSSTVRKQIKGLEVVLVLDNTGSMGASNMAALREASTNFVEILFSRAAHEEDIKIGIVPYSSSVRVGRYGLGEFPDGTPGYGDPFIILPDGVSYTDNHSDSNNWNGCIVEHNENNYDADATHVANSKGQLWTTSAGGTCTSTADCRGHGWDPASNTNDAYPEGTALPYPNQGLDDYPGPFEIYMYGRIIDQNDRCSSYSGYATSRCSSCYSASHPTSSLRNKCNTRHCFCWASTPNIYCPWANVVPLSSDEDQLLAGIAAMQHEGATLSNIGMLWGMRLLSPDPPFTEGVAWGDEEWNKAIVMMTDGQMSIDNAHATAYWAATRYSGSISNALLEERLMEVCDYLKAPGRDVIIYTVTFDHATANISDETKAIYRDCATSPSHYYDAPTQEELLSVFTRISGALANLHIRE